MRTAIALRRRMLSPQVGDGSVGIHRQINGFTALLGIDTMCHAFKRAVSGFNTAVFVSL